MSRHSYIAEGLSRWAPPPVAALQPSAPMRGRWINTSGYRLGPAVVYWEWFCRKTKHEFWLDEFAPLTYVQDDGWMIQPDKHFWTDFGSIPLWLQWYLPKDEFLGYFPHDSAYQSGKGHGLWFAWLPPKVLRDALGDLDASVMMPLLKATFIWLPVTRLYADALLRQMVLSQGCDDDRARQIYRAVRWFGPRW